jgi:chemotaxis protein methyltransferase CheR
MRAADCAELLQWALPRLGLRWAGFRRVRGQVCKRIARRLAALGLGGLVAYRAYLESHPEEWQVLEALCRVHVSRFYRDRALFDVLRDRALPDLAADAAGRGAPALRAWSAGCAAGEEPYTLGLVWHFAITPRFPALRFSILATDVDPGALERARRACYPRSSLKELPAAWQEAAFLADKERDDGRRCLRPELRAAVDFRCEDLRAHLPDGRFDLVLCRNIAFTYFEERQHRTIAAALVERVEPGGWLVIGSHERLDAAGLGLAPAGGCPGAFVKAR